MEKPFCPEEAQGQRNSRRCDHREYTSLNRNARLAYKAGEAARRTAKVDRFAVTIRRPVCIPLQHVSIRGASMPLGPSKTTPIRKDRRSFDYKRFAVRRSVFDAWLAEAHARPRSFLSWITIQPVLP